jgi:hypothetical protein
MTTESLRAWDGAGIVELYWRPTSEMRDFRVMDAGRSFEICSL